MVFRVKLLGAFGGYALSSLFFLKNPEYLHTKKSPQFCCAHISHRGGSSERRENTLEAFHHAVQAKTQMFELDVHMTKDEKIVVFHDGNLERSTGRVGKIRDFNYVDLPLLRQDLQGANCGSSTYKNESDVKIPTLEEVFSKFPTFPICIDIKDNDERLLKQLYSLIKQYNREKITLCGNYRLTSPGSLLKHDPDVPLFFSASRLALLYLWFYTGLLPFIPLKETHFLFPLPDAVERLGFELSSSKTILMKVFGFLWKSSVLYKHLKDRGIPTYLWVVNEEVDFETAFKLGAEGVMTDYPTKLTKWLNEHPQYWV